MISVNHSRSVNSSELSKAYNIQNSMVGFTEVHRWTGSVQVRVACRLGNPGTRWRPGKREAHYHKLPHSYSTPFLDTLIPPLWHLVPVSFVTYLSFGRLRAS